MRIEVDISLGEFRDKIVSYYQPGTIREFIIEIDKAMGDYDFTKELEEYFRGEIEKEDKAHSQVSGAGGE